MPLPTPREGESQDDFISRCHSETADEFPDEEQRNAVCLSQWRQEQGGRSNSIFKSYHGNRGEKGNREWFSIHAQEGEPAEILIYDEIGRGFFGGGIGAEDFIQSVKSLKLKPKDTLTVRINSPGGDLFDGIAIYNYLRTLKAKVNARVDGVAASAATIIAMAGDRIEMPENTFMFVHKPYMMAIGDADLMRETADELDKITEGMVATYLRRVRSGIKKTDVMDMLKDPGTWLTAAEAVDIGFADAMEEPLRAAALGRFDFSRYGIQPPSAIVKARVEELASRRAHLEKLAAGA